MHAPAVFKTILEKTNCLLFMKLFIVCRFFPHLPIKITVYTCMLMNHTIWIEKENCTQCVAVNTTICSGYCYTRDTNLKGRFGRAFLIQRSCVPISLVYRAVFIPGCPQDVSSQLYYPAARCCSCRRCDTLMFISCADIMFYH
uniref:Gonadotropin subunit beta-2 n=1 Tax=Xiphophorus maculatus TaxID=8083 RepID=A0A3B5R2I2_XIPMA